MSEGLLFDAATCIAILQGPSVALREILRTHMPLDQQHISVLTLAQLRHAVLHSADPVANGRVVDAFVSHLTDLPITNDVYNAFVFVMNRVGRVGENITVSEGLVIAQAIAFKVALVMKGRIALPQIDGLRVLSWQS